jgi:hypothetical protein
VEVAGKQKLIADGGVVEADVEITERIYFMVRSGESENSKEVIDEVIQNPLVL